MGQEEVTDCNLKRNIYFASLYPQKKKILLFFIKVNIVKQQND